MFPTPILIKQPSRQSRAVLMLSPNHESLLRFATIGDEQPNRAWRFGLRRYFVTWRSSVRC